MEMLKVALDKTNSYSILLFCRHCKKWGKVKDNRCQQCNQEIENKSSLSFIIPSLSEEPQTLRSIPKDAEVVISKWKPPDEFNSHIRAAYKYDKKLPNELISGMAVARNVGAHYSNGSILFFVDDDIEFSKNFFNTAVSFVENGFVVGLKNPWNNYIIGRFVGITRFDFIVSGGFPPLIIAEDTEFSYRLEALGFKIHYFPEESVKRLNDTAASDYMKFWKYMKTHLTLALMYHVYTKKLPKIFIEYFYRHLRGDYKLKEKKLETVYWWIVFFLKFKEDSCPRCNKVNFSHHGMGFYCTYCHLLEPIWDKNVKRGEKDE